MRKILILIFIITICSCQTDKKVEIESIQKEKTSIDTLKTTNLVIREDRGGGISKEYTFINKPFKIEKHQIDAKNLKIDNEIFYGTKNEFPDYELEAYIKKQEKIILETSGMYNPFINNKGNKVTPEIEIIDVEKGTIIIGTFAQGTETYYAVWFENGKSSKRLSLSKDIKTIEKYKK
jgi:hypothetical protein